MSDNKAKVLHDVTHKIADDLASNIAMQAQILEVVIGCPPPIAIEAILHNLLRILAANASAMEMIRTGGSNSFTVNTVMAGIMTELTDEKVTEKTVEEIVKSLARSTPRGGS